MLMMRVTPKISDSPAPTRNRLAAAASPLSAWNRMDSRVIAWPSSCPRHARPWAGHPRLLCSSKQDVDGTATRACPSCAYLSAASRVNPTCGDKPGHDDLGKLRQTQPSRQARSIHRFGRAQLLHFVGRGEHAGAVDIFEIRHRAFAVLERDLADIGAHRRLLVAGAEFERPERIFQLEAAERGDQFLGVGCASLGDAG